MAFLFFVEQKASCLILGNKTSIMFDIQNEILHFVKKKKKSGGHIFLNSKWKTNYSCYFDFLIEKVKR